MPQKATSWSKSCWLSPFRAVTLRADDMRMRMRISQSVRCRASPRQSFLTANVRTIFGISKHFVKNFAKNLFYLQLISYICGVKAEG